MNSVAAVMVVSLVTWQLNTGLYSKAIVLIAKPTLGMVVKFLAKLKVYVVPFVLA